MSSYTAERTNPGSRWWLLLLQGIAAIILGVLLFTRPAATIQAIVIFLGIYWLITGILTLVSLIWDRSQWGLKIITGILGILAGLFIVRNPIISAFVVPASFALALGILGIVIGIGQLIQAFRGGGWGIGILGVLSIILGVLLLANPAIGGISLAIMLAILLIVGGIAAIIASFGLRRAGKEYEEAQAAARSATAAGSTAAGMGSRAASVTGAAATGVTGATAAGMAAASRAGSDMDYATRGAADTAADFVDDVGDAAAGVADDVGEALGDAAGAVTGIAAAGADAIQSGVEETSEAADEIFTGNVNVFDMDEMVKFKNPLEYIEGIGSGYADKLRAIGIANCLDLIKRGSTPRGRADIAAQSGITGRQILTWVNHVDLYRIRGVGSEYADLLEAAGVDTVVELAQRNAATLFAKLNALNLEQRRVRKPPSQAQVEDWVTQAKGLPRVITY
jgi:uncharacterized membrane protein HdeD (DUF308 family)/predicted flap endonuclease-1-like 5' DNA nuclease